MPGGEGNVEGSGRGGGTNGLQSGGGPVSGSEGGLLMAAGTQPAPGE